MRRLFQHLYAWVLLAILAGGLIGALDPGFAVKLKPLGDGFIALIKMMIAPIIFCTVVLGITQAGNMRKVGRIGGKALLYFEIVSTFALLTGVVVMKWFHPGQALKVDPASLDPAQVKSYTQLAENSTVTEFLLHLIPKTFLDAFTGQGDLLQVVLLAMLTAYTLMRQERLGRAVHLMIEDAAGVFLGMMRSLTKLAPIGAAGAMAFTVGKYGTSAILPLVELVLCFYLTCFLFVIVILGVISAITGFSIFRYLAFIRTELFTVLGTASSETALVPLMEKLERLGCSKSVVGLVVPTGYSFNLDGTNIYITMAALFIAEALNIDLTLGQELTLFGVAMLTSKGASGVTGAGFVTLAATLAVVPEVPVAGLTLILGVDRFMSEARALTNFIGNGIATLVVARWEGDLDLAALNRTLRSDPD
jgi:aerobic C4-dicarboxylate transport protein